MKIFCKMFLQLLTVVLISILSEINSQKEVIVIVDEQGNNQGFNRYPNNQYNQRYPNNQHNFNRYPNNQNFYPNNQGSNRYPQQYPKPFPTQIPTPSPTPSPTPKADTYTENKREANTTPFISKLDDSERDPEVDKLIADVFGPKQEKTTEKTSKPNSNQDNQDKLSKLIDTYTQDSKIGFGDSKIGEKCTCICESTRPLY